MLPSSSYNASLVKEVSNLLIYTEACDKTLGLYERVTSRNVKDKSSFECVSQASLNINFHFNFKLSYMLHNNWKTP